MDLLKKLKSGASKAADVAQQTVSKAASKAADVAQQTVELTKLAAQITARKREIDKHLMLIGQEVYEAHRAGDPSLAEERVRQWLRTIDGLKETIATLERQMRFLRNERSCRCGKAVPGDAKYCPYCGRPLAEEHKRNVIDLDGGG